MSPREEARQLFIEAGYTAARAKPEPQRKIDVIDRQVQRLHAEGLASNDIAARLGIHRRRVGYALDRLGLRPNRRAHPSVHAQVC